LQNVSQVVSINVPLIAPRGLYVVRARTEYLNSGQPNSTASDSVTFYLLGEDIEVPVTPSTSSSGGGGSSSGGGGSGSSEPTSGNSGNAITGDATDDGKSESIISEFVAEITPEFPKIISSFNEGTVISYLEINVKKIVKDVEIIVLQSEVKITDDLVPKTNAYRYLKIESKNLTNELNNALIKIRVDKSWLSANDLNRKNVALFSFNETLKKWEELTTTFASEDGSFFYYEASLDHFSYFVIAAKSERSSQEINNASAEFSYRIILAVTVVGILAAAIIVLIKYPKKKKNPIKNSLSELKGKEVYTDSGEYIGKFQEVILGKNKIESLRVKLDRKSRFKIKGIIIKYKHVKDVGHIIIVESSILQKIKEVREGETL
jgi:PGF-pre-PGF domain-containing protein